MSVKVMQIGSATVTVVRPELTEKEREAAEKHVIEGLERFERMRQRDAKKEANE